jgi:hypothetical protein
MPSDRAWSEWEIVQKKIDSFSTFPFTVKTWTATLSGLLLGLGKGFDFPSIFLLSVPLVPVFFWVVEKKHDQMRRVLSQRAEDLELLLERLNPLRPTLDGVTSPERLRKLRRMPGTVAYIIRAKKELCRKRTSWNPLRAFET